MKIEPKMLLNGMKRKNEKEFSKTTSFRIDECQINLFSTEK
jgi:hypothetical protein